MLVDIPSTISGNIAIGQNRAAGIQMPATWTAANITFQASYDGTTYFDLYDNLGTEYTVTAAASRVILLPMVDFLGIPFLRIRSGTSAVPVAQAAARVLNVQLV